MEKLHVADGIIQYMFPPEPGKHFGFNIVVLLDEEAKRALLIDTAFEKQAAAVHADLRADGIELEGVVISHFHPDHVMGLLALPHVPIYGSERFEETVRHYTEEEERRRFTPTNPVSDDNRLVFGAFDLGFRLAPGHSPCSMHTLIGDRFVHVADNIMTSNTGGDILPWAAFDLIEDHIESLKMLYEYDERVLLLSHGVVLDAKETVRDAILNRVRYFDAVRTGDGKISYEEATEACTCDFLHKEWLIRND